MFNRANLNKFGFRLLIVIVIFFSVKSTMAHEEGEDLFDPASFFYFGSAFFLVMFTWEINDWLIKRQLKTKKGLDMHGSLKVLGYTYVFMVPVSALIYYLGIFEFDHICKIDTEDPWLQFRIDFLRALVLGFGIIVCNIFYHSNKQKRNLERKMKELRQEVMSSKYKSLKSQISPHFLFNSLNTLTSLMYEDRDLASDFVSRLASSYRYILDNREEDLVTLEKELNFLDSFIFMMNVRHEGALKISTDIGVDAQQFLIPTLSLQMLVENALKHNYYSKEKPMEIKIFSVGKLGLVVENTLRKREQREESTKLGLKNIRKRYAFYTRQEVTIETEKGLFKITMPLLHRNEKEIPILSVS
ncbi:MAG: histidine kinase [Bacteroidota bacterium]